MNTEQVATPKLRTMLNKVPEVIIAFWVIKILCTTVGETFADYLNSTLGIGLTNTTYVMSAALAATLVVQFTLRRYVPIVYWLAVVLISVVGTLITDNLVERRMSGPDIRGLVLQRKDAIDPFHRHHKARGVLLDNGFVHLLTRHSCRGYDCREAYGGLLEVYLAI